MNSVLLFSTYPSVAQGIVNDWREQGMTVDAAEHAEDVARFFDKRASESEVDRGAEKPVPTNVLVLPETISLQGMKEIVSVVSSQLPLSKDSLKILLLSGPSVLPGIWAKGISEEEHEQATSETTREVVQVAQELKQTIKKGYYSIQLGTLSPDELRVKLAILFNYPQPKVPVSFTVESFGFKYGVPKDANWVLDARFVPNPYYAPELRELTGKDKPVQDYIDEYPSVTKVVHYWAAMLEESLPDYAAQGKRDFRVSVGCTGGQHRSVYTAIQLVEHLKKRFPEANVTLLHREQERWPNPLK